MNGIFICNFSNCQRGEHGAIMNKKALICLRIAFVTCKINLPEIELLYFLFYAKNFSTFLLFCCMLLFAKKNCQENNSAFINLQ